MDTESAVEERAETIEERPFEWTGQILSERYRVLDKIGEGGMGVVYRAEHIHMRKALAIKILHPELTTVSEVVQRFEREAQAAGQIEHPNVCAATDFGRAASGAFFLVMEYLEGKPLSDVLKDEGSISLPRALRIAQQMCAALSRAHELGIVHRDLKPENVLLVERGGNPDFVKILDFGIARVPTLTESGHHKTLTRAGFVMGTPAYLSPEQGSGQEVDHRADLYSLGIVLFEMISGRRPFDSPSTVELIGMHVTRPAPSLSRMAASVKIPRRLDQLQARLLAKEPHQRPQSAAEVRDELLDILESLRPGTRSQDKMLRVATEAATRAAEGLVTMRNRVSPVLRDVRETAPAALPLLRAMPRWLWAVVGANALLCALVASASFGALGGGEETASADAGVEPSSHVATTPPPPPRVVTPAPPPPPPPAPPPPRPTLDQVRARTDVSQAMALRETQGRSAVVEALFRLYETDASPELAYLLAEAEAESGDDLAALQHAKAALVGNPDLAADSGMKAFVLTQLSKRNKGLAESILERHYLPAATADLETLACSARRQPGRHGAQGLLTRTKSLGAVAPWCSLVVELELAEACEAKRDVVRRIAELGDPRALPALQQLGQGGHRRFRLLRRNGPNACMTEELAQAVERLEGAEAPDAGR
jgi:eukaryotic-like serine/threonine-protein kinase